MKTTNETVWAVGDVAVDPRDGEVVEVTGPWRYLSDRYYPVIILEAGRGGPNGPSALKGERTLRALNDPDYPFERAVAFELVADESEAA